MNRRTLLLTSLSLTVLTLRRAWAPEPGSLGSGMGSNTADAGHGQGGMSSFGDRSHERRDPGGLQETRPGAFEGGQPLGKDKKRSGKGRPSHRSPQTDSKSRGQRSAGAQTRSSGNGSSSSRDR